MDLYRKNYIIEQSKSIKGFNKEMFDFLYKGSEGCLKGINEFEKACKLLDSGKPVEYVKLWFEINYNRAIRFHEELCSIEPNHLDVVLKGIIYYDFSDEQIKALIEEDWEYEYLFKLFKAGLSAKDATENFDVLKKSCRRLIIEAVEEKVNIQKIVEAAKNKDGDKLTWMIARAKTKRINKEFEELMDKYYN